MQDDLAGIVIVDESKQIVKQTAAERIMGVLQRDFDEFNRMKAYVIKNMGYLRGRRVPIEVDSIQNLPTHNCIIINDLLLLSYTEAAEFIHSLKAEEKADGNQSPDERTSAGDSEHA